MFRRKSPNRRAELISTPSVFTFYRSPGVVCLRGPICSGALRGAWLVPGVSRGAFAHLGAGVCSCGALGGGLLINRSAKLSVSECVGEEKVGEYGGMWGDWVGLSGGGMELFCCFFSVLCFTHVILAGPSSHCVSASDGGGWSINLTSYPEYTACVQIA